MPSTEHHEAEERPSFARPDDREVTAAPRDVDRADATSSDGHVQKRATTAPRQPASAAFNAAQKQVERRALVLVNPRARRGGEQLDPIMAYMTARGLEVAMDRIGAPERIPEIIQAAGADKFDCIVICGGDGTISCSLRGVLETGLPLGVLPMGTANDFARTVGIPADLYAAADAIISGRTRRIDVGTVNDLPFINVASIGISSRLAKSLEGASKRRWGRLSYLGAAVRALVQSRPFRATISVDGRKTKVKSMQIAVGNGRYYGGGNAIASDAAIDDGLLDLYSLEVASTWKLLLMAPHFRAGTHGNWNDVRTETSTAFHITTRTPRTINVDGELITRTPAHFRILPGAIEVFAPPRPAM